MLLLVINKLERYKIKFPIQYIFNLELTEVTTENNPWFLKVEFMPFFMFSIVNFLFCVLTRTL